jgi:hypothetical protein
MSRKFLTNIDLNSNELRNGVIHNLATDPLTGAAGQLYFNTVDQVLKFYNGTTSQWEAVGSIEAIGDAVSDLLESGTGISLSYDDEGGTLTIENTGVTSVAGTENEVSVSASAGAVTISLPESITVDVTGDLTGNADTATALETSRTISLGGSLSGSVSFDGSSDVTITADIVADAVALGSDTTGDYVASVSGSGDGISVTGTGEGASVTIENTGVTSVSGTANQVTVSASTGLVTIGLPDDVTIGGDLIVTGDLTVSGSVTTLNTETLLVEDNQITLNSNVTGTPTVNAGIEIERGDLTNAELVWDENIDAWKAGVSGSVTTISLEGHSHVATDITDFNSAVDDEIDAYLNGSDSISVSSGSIDITLLSGSSSYLTTTGGLAVNKSDLETALVSDGFPRKYAEGNGSLTSTGGLCTWTVTHNLGTKDVTVQVYEVAADYAQVEVDVQHTSTSAVTVKINSGSTITADTYRVVVIG